MAMRTLPFLFSSFRGQGALLLVAAIGCAMAPAAAVAAPVTHTVTITAMQFSPQVLEIHAGDTVEWINKDPFPHDVSTAPNSTKKSAKSGFKSSVIAPTASWKFVAGHKGSFAYSCTLHPMMKASLIVR